jgi:L-alanine-DL-glutamate epimerase-like enolase superfamily enzyme
MRLSIEPLTLRLRQPFVIAHGVSTTRENVLVRIDGGVGEAAAVPYLGETRERIVADLERIDLPLASDPLALADLIDHLSVGSSAARAAVDMALHDAFGQRLGQPLYRLLGLNPERIPPSSFTISIGTPEQMAEQARASTLPVLKLKLGGPGPPSAPGLAAASGAGSAAGRAGDEMNAAQALDAARVAAVRAATARPLRADANGGWSREQARRLLPVLFEHGVTLLEQPLAVGDLDGLRELSRMPRRPALFADESIRGAADIVAHAGLVEGVVIKLAKSGGIRAALRDIAVARALGLDVLLSCMIESSLAVTAAAHIAPLCQHVDLDGPLLIDGDPFQGLLYHDGRVILPDRPGLGLVAAVAGRTSVAGA